MTIPRFFCALILMFAATISAGSLDHSVCGTDAPNFSPAADAVDMQSLLADTSVPVSTVCCCTIKTTAQSYELTGAAQQGMAFKALDDKYEVYLRMSANTYQYVGTAVIGDDDGIAVVGSNQKGGVVFKWNGVDAWDWTAYESGVEMGTGQMK